MRPWSRFKPWVMRWARCKWTVGLDEAVEEALRSGPQLIKAVEESRVPDVGVAMSGGVDSAISALLLKRAGCKVTCYYMKNWDPLDEAGGSACNSDDSLQMVRKVCKQLQLPLREFDFIKEYWNDVFVNFLEEYQAGFTPNPDLLCNRHIKFDALLQLVRKKAGHDVLATGHYARVSYEGSKRAVHLMKGTDAGKDQTYFLANVSQAALQHVAFPIGGLYKSQVRELASEEQLPNASRRSSTGICFIGKRPFASFLAEYITLKDGLFVDVDSFLCGESPPHQIGRHNGMQLYTLGQRARIGGQSEAWYVAGKDRVKGDVYIAKGWGHRALYTLSACVNDFFWVSGEPPVTLITGNTLQLSCKARYNEDPSPCRVHFGLDGVEPSSLFPMPESLSVPPHQLHVHFRNPLRAVTPRQALVLYDGDVCLGGGPIQHAGPTLAELAVGTSLFPTESACL